MAMLLNLSGILIAQNVVPGWFIEMPESSMGNMFAIGYSGKYIDRALARQAAINKAVHNMVKQQHAQLRYEIEELSDGRLRLLNPTLNISLDETDLNSVWNNYTPVDSTITDEGYFILISLYEIPRRPGGVVTNMGWSTSRPKWTTTLPKSKSYNYGIGIVSNYASWVRAWNDADEYARFDLGKNLKIETGSIHTVKRDNKYIVESKILRQSYDEIVTGAIIVSRWYDIDNDTYFSLCRQKK